MTEQEKQKLKEKLAKWLGFEILDEPSWERTPEHPLGVRVRYIYPDKRRKALLPNLTSSLDACFKWLAPKVQKEWRNWYSVLLDWLEEWHIDITVNPALALCLAIEKLIDNGSNRKNHRV